VRLPIRFHAAVREPHQRGVRNISGRASTDVHPAFEETYLDLVVSAGLSNRDAIVCLRHEPVVPDPIRPTVEDMCQGGFTTTPAAALAEEPRKTA
jgi:hypothetical protein